MCVCVCVIEVIYLLRRHLESGQGSCFLLAPSIDLNEFVFSKDAAAGRPRSIISSRQTFLTVSQQALELKFWCLQ